MQNNSAADNHILSLLGVQVGEEGGLSHQVQQGRWVEEG
jgi:hypothetical protein